MIKRTRKGENYFTFHDVSINTVKNAGSGDGEATCFTFHDVSINTPLTYMLLIRGLPLHSTMFLLIRKPAYGKVDPTVVFTFHDVSINTRIEYWSEQTLKVLYIPRCFY